MENHNSNAAPTAAKDAVLVKSGAMPDGSQKVEDFDFNKFNGGPISAEELLQGMQHMGFQASSIGEAVRIINDMVRMSTNSGLSWAGLTITDRGHGEIRRREMELPYSSATRRISSHRD